jgi:RNA polymerase sigma-70 factor (ECF subfamily)
VGWEDFLAMVKTDQESFTRFVEEVSPRLTQALVASLGGDLGREMAAEALAYGWEHWERMSEMENPAGYLYKVGRNKGRRVRALPLFGPPPPSNPELWFEPGLPAALARLSERQRTAVMLVHGAGWTLTEAADVLGVTSGAVHRHVERALRRLRESLEVLGNA